VRKDAKFEVVCIHCPMRLEVDRIRQAEIAAMTEHLREEHLELRFRDNGLLEEVLDHFRVMPIRR
jgi:hypothetical protein